MDRGGPLQLERFLDLQVEKVRGILLALVVLSGSFVSTGIARASTARQVWAPVLIYHHIKPLKPTDNATERGLTVLPTQFEAELRYLRGHHYHVITAADLVSRLRSTRRFPSKPVVISFDDGYTDMYPYAYRLLRKYRMRATFFIVPGFLNTPRYLTWPQVKDMARHGMDIEAHTMTHPDLTSVGPRKLQREVTGSRQSLQARLKRVVRLFAYPYGAFNQSVLARVRRAGYLAAFTTHQGWVASSAGLLTLPRVYVDLDDTVPIFAGRLLADPKVLAEDPT